MSTPKQVKSYPEQYMDIVQAIQDDPKKQVSISFDTVAQVHTFRLNFHSFRAAAIREGLAEMYSELPAIYVKADVEHKTAVVSHKNATAEALKIKKALGGV